MEVAVVGGIVLVLARNICKQLFAKSVKSKQAAKEKAAAVVPLSPISDGNAVKKDEEPEWCSKAENYQKDEYNPENSSDFQEMHKKLASSFHEVCKHVPESTQHKINQFL